jgi:hypothetical protein
MKTNALREPAITVRGGIFLIGFGAAIGFSIGTAIGGRRLRNELDELTELHADTRTRVFGLDTVQEAEGVVGTRIAFVAQGVRGTRERPDPRAPRCKECGAPQASFIHLEDSGAGAHSYVGPDDQIFPHAAESDESPGTETP